MAIAAALLSTAVDGTTAAAAAAFVAVTNAAAVLADPIARAAYDARLAAAAAAAAAPALAGTLTLDDLNEPPDGDGAYTAACRCGGGFTIPTSLVDGPGGVVACDTCSLSVRVVGEGEVGMG
ncbi:hypothetical protein MMPV_000985 [Pyropia vietnamensis]